ncbi:hypothetical protein BDW_02160 [Bdellovibrio bacteriovorus W]|nr:hypothetical protein BDW_02160 [Bdellovibrio bacteriovorus W]
MSFWVLLQVLFNLVVLSGVVGMWIRMSRPPKDDPRLSKGLQLLQSKIAVLEDLSDRTETQVKQLTALLESKVKDIQIKIQNSDKQLLKIESSMKKSLEVAKIFQDRIPHNEIVERQSTIKYVKAARLAHQGLSVEEIAEQVDLALGEIEFIAKVNRDKLMFCEDSLPEWINDEISEDDIKQSDLSDVDDISFMPPLQKESPIDFEQVFEIPKADDQALKKLGEAFKAACQEVKEQEEVADKAAQNVSALFNMTQNIAQNFLSEKAPGSAAPTALGANKQPKKMMDNVVRPVEFRRIDMTNDLD